MTEKRFTDDGIEEIENQSFTDNLTEKTYWIDNGLDEIVELLNNFNDENEQLKKKLEFFYELNKPYGTIIEENKRLKSTIKNVVELLSEEVDVFSDKATEHDVYAYKELMELDNKDAYYMATSTKKAIKILKRLLKEE